jgi:hypothetical protein
MPPNDDYEERNVRRPSSYERVLGAVEAQIANMDRQIGQMRAELQREVERVRIESERDRKELKDMLADKASKEDVSLIKSAMIKAVSLIVGLVITAVVGTVVINKPASPPVPPPVISAPMPQPPPPPARGR